MHVMNLSLPFIAKLICFVLCGCNLEDSVADSVAPDQTAPWEQSDVGPYCMHMEQPVLVHTNFS